ncbi:MAG: type IV pili twitching motility protein PilT [Candidatus Omnitrophica bacterium CG11_big_fil_rev_8_21_14_0_20_63_9]|nr:MAG: type IV pili twitching motility protein PilT [Candidatus Omnitrophica bacterium CG11_big_fil_rev_8_21_14_0_20_63_9]
MDLDRLLRAMVEQEASDLFLKVGLQPFLRLHGKLIPVGEQLLSPDDLAGFANELMGPDGRQRFHAERELNFAFDRPGIGRFRANVLWQRGNLALVIRRIQRSVAGLRELNLPVEVLSRLANELHGLVLITGPTGSGKSTTAAAMLEQINQTTPRHIVTLEDPIEFQFEEAQAVINQREVGSDTRSFSEGLRNVLRQSPDVLFLSDIRDRETMDAALLAAEAGQLVISCIHTTNAVTTVERLIAFFPASQHALVRLRLSLVLRGIVCLRLLSRSDGAGRIPVCELLTVTPTVRELIREGRTEQLPSAIQDGAMFGMQTFTQALYQRYRQGEVDLEEALRYADSPEELQLAIREIRPTRDVQP